MGDSLNELDCKSRKKNSSLLSSDQKDLSSPSSFYSAAGEFTKLSSQGDFVCSGGTTSQSALKLNNQSVSDRNKNVFPDSLFSYLSKYDEQRKMPQGTGIQPAAGLTDNSTGTNIDSTRIASRTLGVHDELQRHPALAPEIPSLNCPAYITGNSLLGCETIVGNDDKKNKFSTTSNGSGAVGSTYLINAVNESLTLDASAIKKIESDFREAINTLGSGVTCSVTERGVLGKDVHEDIIETRNDSKINEEQNNNKLEGKVISSEPGQKNDNLPSVCKNEPMLPENKNNIAIQPSTRELSTNEQVSFHCDICTIDLSSEFSIRIRCAECSDFDLCVECFCRGEEKKSGQDEIKQNVHLNTHSYTVYGRNVFPLLSPDWTADEEVLLIDGVSKYGFGNWNDVAELVNRVALKVKRAVQCEQHYYSKYLHSPTTPLPDVGPAILNKGFPSGTSAGSSKTCDEGSSSHLQSLNQSIGAGGNISPSPLGAGGNNTDNQPSKNTGTDGSSVRSSHQYQIVGYWPLRGDFDVEYDNDAELLLADMEFSINDTPLERELKLQIIEIYNSKLDERIFRKRTIINRGLLDMRAVLQKERKRTKEEKELHSLLKPLARFHRHEEQERFIQLLIEEKRIRNRFCKLQEWKSLGLRTLEDVKDYEEEKKRREELRSRGQQHFRLLLEGNQRWLRRSRGSAGQKTTGTAEQPAAEDKTTASYNKNSRENSAAWQSSVGQSMSKTGVNNSVSSVLTQKENDLCDTLQVPPVFYLLMKKILLQEAMARGGFGTEDLQKVFKLEGRKVGKVYDWLFKYSYNEVKVCSSMYENFMMDKASPSNSADAESKVDQAKNVGPCVATEVNPVKQAGSPSLERANVIT